MPVDRAITTNKAFEANKDRDSGKDLVVEQSIVVDAKARKRHVVMLVTDAAACGDGYYCGVFSVVRVKIVENASLSTG